jgi:hypothetical protein
MQTLASIGYKEVETFGPYSWSDQTAQDRWKVTAQSLAFKGSGYFGLTGKEVRTVLDNYGSRTTTTATACSRSTESFRSGSRPNARIQP